MPDAPKQTVVLTCGMCGHDTEHEVHYAGRILAHSKCTKCGTVFRQNPSTLRRNYVKDLEHRVVTKPWRLVARILRDPGYLFGGLPKALRRQPKKFIDEAKELRDTDRHPED